MKLGKFFFQQVQMEHKVHKVKLAHRVQQVQMVQTGHRVQRDLQVLQERKDRRG
jgi:hypothetical protein